MLRRALVVAIFAIATSAPAGAATPQVIDVNGVRTRLSVTSLQELRQRGVMRQHWDSSCGAAALGTVLDYYYGRQISELTIVLTMLKNGDPAKVRRQGGFSLLDLKRFADAVGFHGEGYAELALDDLAEFGAPVIVPVSIRGFDHFVVFRIRLGDRIVISDPAFGNLTMPVGRFLRIWPSRIGFVVLASERSPRPSGTPLGPQLLRLPIPRLLDVSRQILNAPVAPLTRLPTVVLPRSP
jgi:predicted double-glycine peptidase